jgi:L-rhamnose mutarotase
MKRYCFALDLVNDQSLIEEYKDFHRNFWPELREHTLRSGIEKLEIYLVVNRLFMIWETADDFDPDHSPADPNDSRARLSRKWEKLMSRYQQTIPGCRKGEKWVAMEKIFEI